MSLITRVNPLPGWGHAWTRKMTPSIPIFRNEINALGNFRDGVNIASEFTLSEAQKAANTTRSKVRARVEHVFGDQKNGMGAELVLTIGIVRARCKIGMTNLVYNMRRFVCLERMAAAAR
jgi:hypothetical protein